MRVVGNRIIYFPARKEVQSSISLAAAAGCQVQMEIGDDGSVSDASCVSVSCTGTCSLKSKKKNKGTEYWCECSTGK
jgi:hypothetical protein